MTSQNSGVFDKQNGNKLAPEIPTNKTRQVLSQSGGEAPPEHSQNWSLGTSFEVFANTLPILRPLTICTSIINLKMPLRSHDWKACSLSGRLGLLSLRFR